MDERIRLPDGFEVIGDKLCRVLSNNKNKAITNATVKAVNRKDMVDRIKGQKSSLVTIEFDILGSGIGVQRTYEVSQIRSGKFMDDLPDQVIIEPGGAPKAKEVFCWCIQQDMLELQPEEEVRHPFGWDEKNFFVQNKRVEVPEDKGYGIAAEASVLLRFGSDALNAVFLGSIHGPLIGFLADAGIRHNFATDISGVSGIGKTELTELGVNGVTGISFALASNRKDLLKKMGELKDVTLVLDDYNKAESGRTKERVQQTVSELIQGTCNTAGLLIDGSVQGCSAHVIINREEIFKNPSTINRTFWVKMEESLPLGQYNKMKDFSGRGMGLFIYSLIRFVEDDYDMLAEKAGADYRMFLDDARKKYENRIANTIAVQMVLKKIIISYYRHMGFDDRHIQQMDNALENTINRVGREMRGQIKSLREEGKSMVALPRLAGLIRCIDNGYELSKNEKKYWKEKNEAERPQKIGFCVREGYLSFDMESMLELLNNGAGVGEGISKHVLSKELKKYGLAFVDSEGKLCTRMGTTRRMYHVRVERLLELCGEADELNKYTTLSYFSGK
ncbi:MAG: hypothetical protein NC541_12300 [bacterium]|nr:hypothetical protein [bacterium]